MAANDKVRLFVAVFPPEPIIQRLSDTIRGLAKVLPPKAVAWSLPEQIHLTLNFLGSTPRERIKDLEQVLGEVCSSVKAHPLEATGLGCFPRPSRPRIIWAGLSDPSGALLALKNKLDERLVELGYAKEDRPFQAHLTIGRVKEMKASERLDLTQTMQELRETPFGQWTAAQVELMQSVLSPHGAHYSVVKSFQLRSTLP
ncbi:MAG: RNA 2',3'-cyclic phosphodiesterase [Limisphaerales bacterium]